MTHDHSALLDQLTEIASLRSDELGLAGVLPEILRAGLQALIEAEATTKIGAGRYERSADRNGHRPKTISTPAGDVQMRIPKLRAGSFFPVLLERRRRIDKALYAVIMEAYVQGISTRSVDDLVRALGVDSGISKSEVSRICAGLDAEIAEFGEPVADPHRVPIRILRCHVLQGPRRCPRGLPSAGGGDRGVGHRHP